VTNNCRLICRVPFSYCGSVASPQVTVWAPAWAPRSRTCIQSYGLSTDLSTTIKYVRRTASGDAGNGLGTTIKYLRRTRAAGNRLAATIKYLRGAAGISLGTHV
jgi:hypothetical protein